MMKRVMILVSLLLILSSFIGIVSAQEIQEVSNCSVVPIGEIYDPEALRGMPNTEIGPDGCVKVKPTDCPKYDYGGVFFRSPNELGDESWEFYWNTCDSIKKLKVLNCANTKEQIKENFNLKECAEDEICVSDYIGAGGKCIKPGECPAKIKWDTSGKIISEGHYPTVFIRTYNAQDNSIDSIIIYEEYFNSEKIGEGNIKIPAEGLELAGGEDLKEFIEADNFGSYKITYKSPVNGCEVEQVVSFEIKESMSIFDRISEFFRWIF